MKQRRNRREEACSVVDGCDNGSQSEGLAAGCPWRQRDTGPRSRQTSQAWTCPLLWPCLSLIALGWKLNWTLELGVWWTTTPRQVDRGNNGGRCPGTNRPQWSVNTSIDIYPIGGLHSATQTPTSPTSLPPTHYPCPRPLSEWKEKLV